MELLRSCLPAPFAPTRSTASSSDENLLPSSSSSARGQLMLSRQPSPSFQQLHNECVFCDVCVDKGFKIVYEDNRYAVFRDRSPGSRVHLLAIPKAHYENIKTLNRHDIEMLRELKEVGTRVLDELRVPRSCQRMGFHIPPFYSVKHLHLHLLSLPLPFPGSFKYCPSFPRSWTQPPPSLDSNPPWPNGRPPKRRKRHIKGWSWFIDVDQAIAIIEADAKVKVGNVKIYEQPSDVERGRRETLETREAPSM